MNGPTKAVGPPWTPLPARKSKGVLEKVLDDADAVIDGDLHSRGGCQVTERDCRNHSLWVSLWVRISRVTTISIPDNRVTAAHLWLSTLDRSCNLQHPIREGNPRCSAAYRNRDQQHHN